MGDSEIDQIFKIFKVLGTPNKDHWPDALQLADFSEKYPKFRPMKLGDHVRGFSDCELDFLKCMMQLDPAKRVSVRMALLHPYFDSMEKSMLPFEYDDN